VKEKEEVKRIVIQKPQADSNVKNLANEPEKRKRDYSKDKLESEEKQIPVKEENVEWIKKVYLP